MPRPRRFATRLGMAILVTWGGVGTILILCGLIAGLGYLIDRVTGKPPFGIILVILISAPLVTMAGWNYLDGPDDR
jgi:F0F1-type ATP synthase assembly protein I